MNPTKRKKLAGAGWKVGSAAEFLGLSPEEELLVAMKLALAANVRRRRQQLKLTQQDLAQRIGSSQSRVAKIETADTSVSLELMVRSLASLGATRKEIGRIVGSQPRTGKSRKARSRQFASK